MELFSNLIYPILAESGVRGLGVTKDVKEVGFEGVWGELGSGHCFRGQWLTGCFGLALVFIWGGVGKAFLLVGGLGAGLSFYAVWNIS